MDDTAEAEGKKQFMENFAHMKRYMEACDKLYDNYLTKPDEPAEETDQ